MTERDIIRRLQDSPVPPPPEDLAARIIKDIPDDIEIHPDLVEAGPDRRFIHRQPVWLAAAAVAAVALTAAVTWELRTERPTETMLSQPPAIEVADEKQRLELAPQPAIEEQLASAAKPAGEGDTSEQAPSLLGVTQDSRRLNEAHEVTAQPEPGTSEEFKRQAPGRDLDAVIHEPAPSADTESEEFKRPVERLLPRTKAKSIITPPQPPVDDNRSQREFAGGSTRQRGIEKESTEADSASLKRSRVFSDGVDVTDYSKPIPTPRNETMIVSQVPAISTFAGEVVMIPDSSPAEVPPSTGGTAEPNDKPYGDVFFEHSGVNPFVDSEDDRLSTFALDVDTGSYTVARRYLHDGNLPPHDAIRVEEFVNSFDYGDTAPRRDDFRLTTEGAPSAFMRGERYYTLRMAVKAREVDADDRPPAVLVFCIDVSGSMARESRLELVKKALYELLENLRRDDYVGLVIYGSTGEVVLRPTSNHDEIRRAIGRLRSGGSTNAEEGLSLAYDLLDDGEDDGRIRRVILCSDGVANVGRTGPASILERIRNESGEGIELTTVGFGMGNYNDTLMEQLADAGDGRYAYVDDLTEARRIFVEELTGTLFTLGREAKAQVEFDPEVVSRWRLLGYENRDIADERFRDPTVDAGEIGAGHTVTALYEVKLQDDVSRSDTVATLRFRYRPTGREEAVEVQERLRVGDLKKTWEKASPSLKLASLVAEFAELLKGTYWSRDGDFEEVLVRLQNLQSDFSGDTRVAEFTGLVARAAALQPDKAEADNR